MPWTLTVELAERSYPIIFDGPEAVAAPRAQRLLTGAPPRFFAITDENVARHHRLWLERARLEVDDGQVSRLLVLPAGEQTKNIGQLEHVYAALGEAGIGRDGCIYAFGGGVIGDLAGFAAATWLRGIDFYQVPTTLLAMVDSSVGGKTGINTPAGKNLVGAFWQPRAVYIDTALLETLPEDEFAAGMAEVIKYGMLGDRALFDELAGADVPLRWNHPELPRIIRRCCELKAGIVRADETEAAPSGGRALLNLGHTFAHAIEQVAGYGEYLHGEAVAIGLALAARYSREEGGLSERDVLAVEETLGKYELPTHLRKPLEIEALLAAMRRDKKTRGGRLRLVLMEALGKAVTADGVSEERVRALWLAAGAA